jgi:hypothetical protein
MFASTPYDAAGPLVMVGLSCSLLIILTLIISTLESVVMFLLKWGRFSRSLWASLLMNIASTMFGLVALAFLDVLIGDSNLVLAIAFVLSVLIEGGVLMLMKRGATRQNWIASLTANLASYLFIILPLFVLLKA